jgi:hypothetical protein
MRARRQDQDGGEHWNEDEATTAGPGHACILPHTARSQ